MKTPRTSRRRARGFIASLAVAALAAGLAPAQADDPSPEFVQHSIEDRAYAEGRGIDQLANPDYALRFMPYFKVWAQGGDLGDSEISTDPFLLDWVFAHGSAVHVTYPNRYGAIINAHLWIPKTPFVDPVTGLASNGPFPAVIVIPGYGSVEGSYWGLAQGLAEAGYVVMTFDPQGSGRSETDPNPTSVWCDPAGAWKQPQEFGLSEQGSCAGIDPPAPAGTPADVLLAFDHAYPNDTDFDAAAAVYPLLAPRYVFGALDAATWLLSSANPYRSLVDATRLGVAGHSIGAWSATMVGNGDMRFRAAVSWDGFGPLPSGGVGARVPTMFQHEDFQNWVSVPDRSPPDPDILPGSKAKPLFDADGVSAMQVVLRGSTHQEWPYVPYRLINPFGTPVINSSRQGERVALYDTQAWFDRYLKGASPTGFVRGDEAAQAADAVERLRATVFDSSVDGSSHGQGAWDPATQANAPYTIGGEAVADHLSYFYRSWYAFDGFSCVDVRAGCS